MESLRIRQLQEKDAVSLVRLGRLSVVAEKIASLMKEGSFFAVGAFTDKELVAYYCTDYHQLPSVDAEGITFGFALAEPVFSTEVKEKEKLEKKLLKELLQIIPQGEVTTIATTVKSSQKDRIKLLFELGFEFEEEEVRMVLVSA